MSYYKERPRARSKHVAALTLYKNRRVSMVICLSLYLYTKFPLHRPINAVTETKHVNRYWLTSTTAGMLLLTFPRFYTSVQYVCMFTLALVRVQRHVNLFPFLPCHFLKTHFNIILPCTSMSRLPKRSLSLKFLPTKALCVVLFFPIRGTCS